jgi:hypothetical protein
MMTRAGRLQNIGRNDVLMNLMHYSVITSVSAPLTIQFDIKQNQDYIISAI